MDHEKDQHSFEIREPRSWHSIQVQDVIAELDSDNRGLEKEEAKVRLQSFGYNEFEKEKKTSSISLFLHQFKNILVIILLAASRISLELSEIVGAVVILVIIFFV